MSLATAEFWKATAERGAKTVAQTVVAGGAVAATGVVDHSWIAVLVVTCFAAVASVFTSVASSAATGDGPSATNTEVIPQDQPDQDQPDQG